MLRVSFGLGEAGREFKDAAALSETIGGYLEAIVATANEIPPLWTISPELSPNYRQVNELLPRLRKLVASVIAERRSAADEGTATGLSESADRADLRVSRSSRYSLLHLPVPPCLLARSPTRRRVDPALHSVGARARRLTLR